MAEERVQPGVSSPIVDVKKLADGVTSRTFGWRAPQGFDYGGVVVQPWRSSCTEIIGSRWRSYS